MYIPQSPPELHPSPPASVEHSELAVQSPAVAKLLIYIFVFYCITNNNFYFETLSATRNLKKCRHT